VKVPKVTHLNKLTSSDLKGILFLVEGIVSIPGEVRRLATRNFSSWEDVRKTLVVEPAVIARLQDRLADRPDVKGRVENPGDFPAESSLRLRPGHLVHLVRGRHILIALRQMQGQLFVGPEAQIVESTTVLFLAFHIENACLAGARELDLSARWL
jgi:hypothetical protein